MSQRQLKKKRKKYVPVIADETNLLFMTDEEREQAIKDYRAYVKKYAYRKKYKHLKGKYLRYFYPLGNSTSELLQFTKTMFSRSRKASASVTVSQSLKDLI